jgi:hypothetical protein
MTRIKHNPKAEIPEAKPYATPLAEICEVYWATRALNSPSSTLSVNPFL